MTRWMLLCGATAILEIAAVTGAFGDDIRRTPAVEAVEKAYPRVAAVYVQKDRGFVSGSGTVIDPRGYVLTADHLLGGPTLVLLPDRPPLKARTVARLPERDLAVLQIGQRLWTTGPRAKPDPLEGQPIPFLPLGSSSEMLLGETILNIGNPGGRGVVVTQGIISSTGQVLMNALGLAGRRNDPTDRLIQFDAPSHGGNSGGALVDLRGRQIGVSSSGIRSEEGTNYAVPIDVFHEHLADMLHAELRGKYVSGITLDWQQEHPTIAAIKPGSPAAQSDLKVGDVITHIGSFETVSTTSFELSRLGWQADQSIELTVVRDGGQPQLASITPAHREPTASVDVESPVPGLLCRSTAILVDSYSAEMPFAKPIDADPVIVPVPVAAPPGLAQTDWYELSIDGYLKIESDGVYRFELESDDGSRLYLHGEPIVENGDNHPMRTRSAWRYLAAGLHPIKVAYFEATGSEELELRVGLSGRSPEPVQASQLFHQPPLDDE